MTVRVRPQDSVEAAPQASSGAWVQGGFAGRGWFWWLALPLLLAAALVAATLLTTRVQEHAGQEQESSRQTGVWRTVETAQGPVALPAAPRRIVSCVPAADEILVKLVPLSRLWAVTYNAAASRWSFAREALQHVPNERRIRFVDQQSDQIVAWQPDLVIVGSFTDAGFRERMRHAGIPLLTLHAPDSLEAIRANVKLLARATGEDAAGEAMLADMQRRLAVVREQVAGRAPVRALYLALYGGEMSSVGRGSTLDVQLELAGYENVARRKLSGPWGPLSFEQVARLDRAVELEVLLFPLTQAANDTREPEARPHAERFQALPGARLLGPLAAEPPRILEVPEAYIQVSSHHIVSGIEWFVAQRPK